MRIVACVHNPLRGLEQRAPQKTSGVVDKRRYVHDSQAVEKRAPDSWIFPGVVRSFRIGKMQHEGAA
jgi:hypothetical protein